MEAPIYYSKRWTGLAIFTCSKNHAVMVQTTDILGKVLTDYKKDGFCHPLFVHTSYSGDETYEVDYFFRDFGEMPDIERFALAGCRGRVLDIGAGAGSHSLYLQDQGFDVTALDTSPGCVNVMVDRGLNKVMQADVFNLTGGGYNTLLLLMNGIGITGNLQGMVRFLELADKITVKGAQILFDTTNVSFVVKKKKGESQYPGELKYRFEYCGNIGPWFGWLYLDQEKLFRLCDSSPWIPQIIYENGAGQYLARLWKKY